MAPSPETTGRPLGRVSAIVGQFGQNFRNPQRLRQDVIYSGFVLKMRKGTIRCNCRHTLPRDYIWCLRLTHKDMYGSVNRIAARSDKVIPRGVGSSGRMDQSRPNEEANKRWIIALPG